METICLEECILLLGLGEMRGYIFLDYPNIDSELIFLRYGFNKGNVSIKAMFVFSDNLGDVVGVALAALWKGVVPFGF